MSNLASGSTADVQKERLYNFPLSWFSGTHLQPAKNCTLFSVLKFQSIPRTSCDQISAKIFVFRKIGSNNISFSSLLCR